MSGAPDWLALAALILIASRLLGAGHCRRTSPLLGLLGLVIAIAVARRLTPKGDGAWSS